MFVSRNRSYAKRIPLDENTKHFNLDKMVAVMQSNTSLPLHPNDLIRIALNEYMKKLNFTITFVQLFIVLFGLFGNTLAVIVINRKSLRNSSSAVFITHMAILDSAVLLLHAATLVLPRRSLIVHCSLTYLTDLLPFCANWVLVIITLGNENVFVFITTKMKLWQRISETSSF